MPIMMVAADDAVSVEWNDPDSGVGRRRLDYFGRASQRSVGAQAHMAVIDSTNPIPTHCHTVDQFQIMFGVPGSRFQRRAIPPVLVQYADAYTVYGPITTDEETLQFLTLRAVEGAGIFNMPADRDRVPRRGGRHFSATPPAIDARQRSHGLEVEHLIGPEDDGLAAYLMTAGADTDITIAAPEHSSGQYVCVIDGSLQLDGSLFGPRSLAWHPAGDQAAHARSGPDGCRIVVMKYALNSSDDESESGE